jgi:hypothetical protein
LVANVRTLDGSYPLFVSGSRRRPRSLYLRFKRVERRLNSKTCWTGGGLVTSRPLSLRASSTKARIVMFASSARRARCLRSRLRRLTENWITSSRGRGRAPRRSRLAVESDGFLNCAVRSSSVARRTVGSVNPAAGVAIGRYVWRSRQRRSTEAVRRACAGPRSW